MTSLVSPSPYLTILLETAARARRFSVEQYLRMVDAGILPEDNTCELLEGWVIDKAPKTHPHVFANEFVGDALKDVLSRDQYRVFTQNPVILQRSVPEPDQMVARGSLFSYQGRLPQAADVLLVVEVSDSTLAQDRTIKQRIYAGARIPFYWILNLVENVTEVYANPHGDGEDATYDAPTLYAPDQPVPLILNGAEVARLDSGACYPAS